LIYNHARMYIRYSKKACISNIDSISVLSNGYFEDQRDLIRKLK